MNNNMYTKMNAVECFDDRYAISCPLGHLGRRVPSTQLVLTIICVAVGLYFYRCSDIQLAALIAKQGVGENHSPCDGGGSVASSKGGGGASDRGKGGGSSSAGGRSGDPSGAPPIGGSGFGSSGDGDGNDEDPNKRKKISEPLDLLPSEEEEKEDDRGNMVVPMPLMVAAEPSADVAERYAEGSMLVDVPSLLLQQSGFRSFLPQQFEDQRRTSVVDSYVDQQSHGDQEDPMEWTASPGPQPSRGVDCFIEDQEDLMECTASMSLQFSSQDPNNQPGIVLNELPYHAIVPQEQLTEFAPPGTPHSELVSEEAINSYQASTYGSLAHLTTFQQMVVGLVNPVSPIDFTLMIAITDINPDMPMQLLPCLPDTPFDPSLPLVIVPSDSVPSNFCMHINPARFHAL